MRKPRLSDPRKFVVITEKSLLVFLFTRDYFLYFFQNVNFNKVRELSVAWSALIFALDGKNDSSMRVLRVEVESTLGPDWAVWRRAAVPSLEVFKRSDSQQGRAVIHYWARLATHSRGCCSQLEKLRLTLD